ncbi:hypothetical protein [Mesorhizobium sp. INR15]|uniref:hypothetical protein n=1 Tax=Mesorhizobium sp. INR15 TaxID=2654248 RepID=UPI0018965BC3|nr:hypothetical protein [Mesorhizobium sp. INR15]QPC91481.1 hypothetical protein GA829_13150 [Mesorhizobium sp. INR15]
MAAETHDYSNLSDDGLARALMPLKLELNAGYGKNPTAELTRFAGLQARVAAIRAEQKRREEKST